MEILKPSLKQSSEKLNLQSTDKKINMASVGQRREARNKFQSLGGKVKNLLKVKPPDHSVDVINTDKLQPNEPRFSSLLSPTAQFAMMKCYEDTVYEQICKHHPASKLFLRRSKTPVKGTVFLGEDNPESQEIRPKEEEKNTDGQTEKVDVLNSSLNSNSNFTNPSTRPGSFPLMKQAHKRRILFSQRLQSAMDILDTVRGEDEYNQISPRISTYPRKIQPVSDFNVWSSVWSNEFRIVKK